MRRLQLFLLSTAITFCTYSQDKNKGIVSYGSRYIKEIKSTTDENGQFKMLEESIIDTLKVDFTAVINSTKMFINITGIEDLPFSSINIDEIEVTNQYEEMKEYDMTLMYDQQGYTRICEYNIQSTDGIVNVGGKWISFAVIKVFYDFTTKEIKMLISYVEDGVLTDYVFILNEINHLDWEYGLLYRKVIKSNYLFKVKRNENADNEVIEKKESDFLIEINDTSYVVTADGETNSKHITYRFAEENNLNIIAEGDYLIAPFFISDDESFYHYFDYDKAQERYKFYNSYRIFGN